MALLCSVGTMESPEETGARWKSPVETGKKSTSQSSRDGDESSDGASLKGVLLAELARLYEGVWKTDD